LRVSHIIRNTMRILLILGLALAVLSSCVPKNKFDNLLLSNGRTQVQRDSLLQLANQLPDIQEKLKNTASTLKSTDAELKKVSLKYASLQDNFGDVQKRYDDLLQRNESILTSSSSQVQNLTSQLSTKEKALNERERKLGLMEDQLKTKEALLSKVNENYSEYEDRIKNLEQTLMENQAQIDKLKSSITAALTGFKDSDLSVTEKDGKIYVSLSQKLLFASGSDIIDSKGVDAIRKLAAVLKTNPDISINVEGHTDAQGSVDKNWDLSVRRATSVVKILTGNGVAPIQVTASGRALYAPVSDNESVEGRALNRRTEIILAPRLSEIYQLVKGK